MPPQLSFVLPFYDDDQAIQEQLDAIAALGAGCETLVFDERLIRSGSSVRELIEAKGARYLPDAHRNRAALFNDGLRHAGAEFVCVLPPDILPGEGMVSGFLSAFADAGVFMAYSDYAIVRPDGGSTVERLWPFRNNIDERFSLGYFRVYRRKSVLDAGGFDEDLDHAEEYDLRLRLQTEGKVAHVPEPLYRSVMRETPAADPALSKLHSPGQGAQGGFSYLFYTPEMEREIEFTFKNYLKRVGCFLTHANRKVPYLPEESFETTVSIVIPILNRRRFIRHTVDTVLRGSFEDFEILIVDNGSTDGTQDEVNAIEDPRVRLVQHDGSCIAEALNRGIREANGKYIAQLDSDDEYVPETLELMVAHMETHPKCGLAISYYDLIDLDSNVIEELGVIKHLEFDRNNILRVDGGGALRFFHRKVLEEFGLYNVESYGNFGEDYDMVLKISEVYDVDRVHKVLYRYRRHEDNTDVQRPADMKVNNKNNARQDALARRKVKVADAS